jgi:hypothetical protein
MSTDTTNHHYSNVDKGHDDQIGSSHHQQRPGAIAVFVDGCSGVFDALLSLLFGLVVALPLLAYFEPM